ncbi:MAG TPA: exopolysaccharide biosynthesis polyprenyl glycosylphosphotransferase [Bryobacteraceae bacterium]|nr:exopolysaccharide biosynthesis polyprenyl glycosylphosphotransferase [Bryobacteraceae bacterium]
MSALESNHLLSDSRTTDRSGSVLVVPIEEAASCALAGMNPRQWAGVRAAALKWTCSGLLLLADLAALSLAAAISIATWRHGSPPLDPAFDFQFWPVWLLFPAAYAASGLYPGLGRNPVEELRKLSTTSSLVYPAIALTLFLFKDAAPYSPGVFLLAWIQTLAFVPLTRALVRSTCLRRTLWGQPAIVAGGQLQAPRLPGLEVQQRLLRNSSRLVKRTLDLLFVFSGGVLAFPLLLFIAALVKLTSPGPVFYGQVRYGRYGLPFTAWKFRSMIVGSDDVLEECLHADPDLREEWRIFQKLKNDPRITTVGRFLRRTSLDELPQLWNIVLGEMSIVGPRPIIESEITRYGDGFRLYKKVTPGLTGLWQISGRNKLSYEQRVSFDLYYVRNWSLWLDLYILARTGKVVLQGEGAY